MDVYAYELKNNAFERLAVIDSYRSLIWVKRFQELGECEMYIAATAELMEIFDREHIFLARASDPESLMYVRSVELQTDPEDGDFLIIKGQPAECLVGFRITWGQQTIGTGTSGSAAEILLRHNLTDPDRPTGTAESIVAMRQRRKMPFMKLGNIAYAGSGFKGQFDSENLLDAVYKVLVGGGLGLRSRFTGGSIYLDVYRGLDRTTAQNVNPRVVFSAEYENIGETSYLTDNTMIATMAVVLGEGNGSARARPRVETAAASGIDHVEIAVDASGVSRTTTDGEMEMSEYIACLEREGYMQLGRRKVKRSFEGEIVNDLMYRCGTSYDLGDKVTVANAYGVTGSAYIMEITEVVDENGQRVYPTLSEWTIEE